MAEEKGNDAARGWRPFYEDGWSGERQSAARALWQWHLHLYDTAHPALDGDDLTAYFEAERKNAEAGEPLHAVPEEVWQAAYDACERFDLPRHMLARQVRGARLAIPPVRFESRDDLKAFLAFWTIPHARLLAHLGEAAYTWQLHHVDELAQGFFLTGRLVHLPREVAQDRIYFPRAELRQYDVTEEDLREGCIDENVKGFLWKQIVRARDHLGQGHQLTRELTGRRARALRKWWMGAMDMLREIEDRGYDVWSEPVALSRFQRWRIQLFALVGSTQMRAR